MQLEEILYKPIKIYIWSENKVLKDSKINSKTSYNRLEKNISA